MKKTRKIHETVRIVNDTTPFAIKEAFNQLRTNIMYTPNDGEGCPVYGITSAEMSVGKSTISANLALSFAQLGKKVLIIDADMRRPTINKYFGLDKKNAGLSELLSNIKKSEDEVVTSPYPGLYVITSGAIPQNPSALMLGKRIGELIDTWKKEYDIVFIDLPPVGIVTDPITISSHIGGYIVVVNVNESDAIRVNKAIEAIDQVGAKIVGVVINGTSLKGEGYRYTKGKYEYSYGYYAEDKNGD